MVETTFKPWLCSKCGYVMDTTSHPEDPTSVPTEGDASLCLNCGALYILHSGKWEPITQEERDTMPPDARAAVERIERVRRFVVRRGIAQNGGRA